MVDEEKGGSQWRRREMVEEENKNPNFHQSFPFYIAENVCHVIY